MNGALENYEPWTRERLAPLEKARTDIDLPYKEAENFCQILAEGYHDPSIAWYKLTGQMYLSQTKAKSQAKKLTEDVAVISDRIDYLKGLHVLELSKRKGFTREELEDILVERLKDDHTHSRDIASLSRVVMDLNGWDAPKEVFVKNEIQHLLGQLDPNKALPKDDAIEISCTSLD